MPLGEGDDAVPAGGPNHAGIASRGTERVCEVASPPRGNPTMTASAFFADALDRWNQWLESVELELLLLHKNRDVWKKTVEMMRANDLRP